MLSEVVKERCFWESAQTSRSAWTNCCAGIGKEVKFGFESGRVVEIAKQLLRRSKRST
jgi:hypothetical protein